MTNEEVIEILRRARKFYLKEYNLMMHKEALRATLLGSGIRYDRDKVMSSPTDKMCDTCAEIDRIERELDGVRDKIIETRLLVTKMVNRLPRKERYVLRMYYLNGWTIAEISKALSMSPRHCFRLKDNGIRMVAESWKEK